MAALTGFFMTVLIGVVTSLIATIIATMLFYLIKNRTLIPRNSLSAQFKRYALKTIRQMEHPQELSSTSESSVIPVISEFDIVSSYVPLTGVQYVFEPDKTSGIPLPGDLTDHLLARLMAGDKAYYVVIGEFGTGKSTLVARLAYDLLKKFLSKKIKCIPVIIPMRYLGNPDILSESARLLRERYGISLCTREYLVRAVRSGQIVLMLDGLDEFMSGSPNRFPTHEFKALEEVITPLSRVVITSRRGIFRTAEELSEYFRGRSEDPTVIPRRIFSVSSVKVIELQMLTDEQINRVLVNNGLPTNVRNAIFSNKNILGLARQHILLHMIVNTVPSLDVCLLEEMNVARLYEVYISLCIKRDDFRLPMSESDILNICENIALEMYKGNREELDQSAINQLAWDILQARHGMASFNFGFHARNLLFMTTTEGQHYKFMHRTIMEFFVARGLVHAIRHQDFSGLDVKSIVYHESICHFSRDLLTKADIPTLAGLLEHQDPWVRFTAAHYLSRLNAQDAKTIILERLKSEKEFIVFREFFIALAFLGLVQQFHDFISELDSDPEKDKLNDSLIIEYFGGNATALDGCCQRLDERGDYPTREMLIRFLGHKGSKHHIPIIRPFREDGMEVISQSAAKAINEIKSRVHRPDLIRALLLDLDGVVIDSINHHILGWQQACKRMSMEVDTQIIKLSEGLKSIEVARRIADNQRVALREEELHELVCLKHKFMAEGQRIQTITHIRELAQMAKRKGASVVLVTASNKEWAEAAARAVGLDLIDSIVNEDDTVIGKPAPDPYLLALRKLRCPPGEAIVVENAPLGIDSAHSAGIYCVALTSTLESKYLDFADQVINDPLELFPLLEKSGRS